MINIKNNNNKLPTKWANIKEIKTWIGSDTSGKQTSLLVIHHCGDDNEALINQLETMIDGLKNGFDAFAG